MKYIQSDIWNLYFDLKKYKASPDPNLKIGLDKRFDQIFAQNTDYALLNQALSRIHKNKPELLRVLDRPDIPIHNNLSENDIRKYVKKRKISGSTQNESGHNCRDTFTILKKTCRKLGISFWNFLLDRIKGVNEILSLS